MQEEIRFAVCPETLVALALNAVMADGDAIVVRGATQWSAYRGYGFSLEYAGDFVGTFVCWHSIRGLFCVHFVSLGHTPDATPMASSDATSHAAVTLVCVDAADYRRGGVERQYGAAAIEREATKLVVALRQIGCARFATGNWGCGVFKGDLLHKALIQWLAASLVAVDVVYLPYDAAQRAAAPLRAIVTHVRATANSVGALYRLLVDYERARDVDGLAFADYVLRDAVNKD